ncbi:hypothetical protein [Acinetobacter guillouiae]|uniref:hypothetical protein n=1 Tax=Acinetobacter guillouiae TaxID=106649 RepID=UPI001AE9E72B|nr:hypothetical protein [Acinetobacter guillouiae]MBP2544343.1 hypothetical protein [Acinetobacter guillouiae]
MGLLDKERNIIDFKYFKIWEILELLYEYQVKVENTKKMKSLFSPWSEVAKFLGYYKFDSQIQLYESDRYGRITAYIHSASKHPILDLIENLSKVFFLDSKLIRELEDQMLKYYWLQDDLYSFTPLMQLEDFSLPTPFFFGGEASPEDILNYEKYEEYNRGYLDILKEEKDMLHEQNQTLLKQIENYELIIKKQDSYSIHPSLDPTNINHAPELILAIKTWEKKYISNAFPYKEHTPAIESILRNEGYDNERLIKRISAITNPNKSKNKKA